MMLKDKFSKFFNTSKNVKDPFKLNIMDGFVDIKGYKVKEDGSKKMVYHDCGDNVVTDWMRQIIMMALTGTVSSEYGTDTVSMGEEYKSITKPNLDNHNDDENKDGYILNSKQYFWREPDNLRLTKYSNSSFIDNKYSLFPTKVLFGTGKEYQNWDILKSENEASNNAWYKQMVSEFSYGGGDEEIAKKNFNSNIDNNYNIVSGTIADGITSGDGNILKSRTVNINSSLDMEITNSSTNRSVGVVGPVKTMYFNKNEDDDKIDNGVIKPEWQGIGRPCFIYFRTTLDENNEHIKEAWNDTSSDIFLSKDNDSKFINKITFKINMPAQSAVESNINGYYPYNNYTLRQVGLYNDSIFRNNPNKETIIDDDIYLQNNMPCGTLLAIKNIAPLEKNKDLEFVMTWTLTI